MTIKIISVHYNQPEFVLLQSRSVTKYVQDGDVEYVVFNDARPEKHVSNFFDDTVGAKIQQLCQDHQIRCVNVPQSIHQDQGPSARTATALQWALTHHGFRHDDILMVMDSDMFFIRDINLRQFVSDRNLIYIEQRRGHVRYMWNGIFFMKPKEMPRKEMFSLAVGVIDGQRTDTGGHTHYYLLYNEKQLKSCPTISQVSSLSYNAADVDRMLKRNEISEPVATFLKSDCFSELYLDACILHYRAGGNWEGLSKEHHDGRLQRLRLALSP